MRGSDRDGNSGVRGKRYEGRIKDGGILLSVHCDNSNWRAKAKPSWNARAHKMWPQPARLAPTGRKAISLCRALAGERARVRLASSVETCQSMLVGNAGGNSHDICDILVAFGSQIETRILFHIGHELGPFILLMWTGNARTDIESDQYCRNRTHLSQRSSTYPALAYCSFGCRFGYGYVVRCNFAIWSVGTATPTTTSSMVPRRRHRPARPDVFAVTSYTHRRRI